MLRQFLSKVLAPTMVLAIGLIAFFWMRSRNAPPERTRQAPRAALVETMVFKPSVTGFEIQVAGNVVPRREVTISAEVSGAVVMKPAELQAGRFVRQGTLLLRIDPTQYDLEVKELGSQLVQIAQDLLQLETEESGNTALIEIAEGELKLAKKELARVKGLFAKEAAVEADLDQSERTILKARNALRLLQNTAELIPIRRDRLQAQIKSTELRQQQAQLKLDQTTIVAPFDGVIAHDAVEQGNFAQAGDVLLKIEETAAVEIECNLRTDDLYWLWNSREPQNQDSNDDPEQLDRAVFEVPSATATVTYTVGGREFHWQGKLARYEGRGVDRTTRTVPCRVIASRPKQGDAVDGPPALMRGMYVTVTLQAAPRIRLWKIPNRAIRPNGQVWTIHDGRLRFHQVNPARILPQGTLIRVDATDLKSGDRLIVSQLATAFDGMQVQEAKSGDGSP